jgi:hypothetical protein
VGPRAVLDKNSQPPPGIELYNPDRPARSLVSIPIELSRHTDFRLYRNLMDIVR